MRVEAGLPSAGLPATHVSEVEARNLEGDRADPVREPWSSQLPLFRPQVGTPRLAATQRMRCSLTC